eukprot:GEMP01055321.1.p1 GENE.GEMP01055321.1~~GEMP01055321.1.p1  ORF type:complete len:497 (+),score=90.20 GEMP01055321.1:41-1492(+)
MSQALLLTPFEAEHYVESLERFQIQDVGSSKWLTQHEHIEKLNQLAHAQAKDGTDEFVVDYLQTHDKIKVLIYDLLLCEIWREHMYPRLLSHIAPMSSLRNYIPLYHEASCINLLECSLFHATSAEAAGDAIVDLIDYIYRRLVYLVHTPNQELTARPPETSKEAGEWTNEEVLEQQRVDTDFQVSMCAVSVLRFLTDHRASVPLTVTSRLMETHDVLLLLVPLMEKAPWVRKRRDQIEKFEEQEWVKVADDDIAQLPKLHSQVWLSIYNLVMDGECRARYQLTSFRKDNLLRLRRYLNEIVFDQIPPLSNLLRQLEEMSITGNFTGEQPVVTPFVVEVVAEIRETMLAHYDGRWDEIVATVKKEVFVKETEAEMRRLGDMITMPDLDEYICAKCDQLSSMRCSRCKKEWYCSRDCQVAHWPDHKIMCDLNVKADENSAPQDAGGHRTSEDIMSELCSGTVRETSPLISEMNTVNDSYLNAME